MLNAQSGYTQGTVGVGVDLIGRLGIKLDSGAGRTGSLLLPEHGNGSADDFSSLGAAVKLKVSRTELKVGELLPTLPILQYNDARLLPQTFQGAMLTSKEFTGLTLNAGQMRSFTQRNSSNREDLFIDGRAYATSDRYNYLGGEYRFNQERTMVGLWGGRAGGHLPPALYPVHPQTARRRLDPGGQYRPAGFRGIRPGQGGPDR